MTVASMTGFARADGQDGGYSWTWEVRSVNARGLDLRCRLPFGYDRVESASRAALSRYVKRGSVTLNLSVAQPPGAARLRVNRALLEQIMALRGELAGAIESQPPRLENLLRVPGVVETVTEEEEEEQRRRREEAVLHTLEHALSALASARAEEGARLAAVLRGHIDDIARRVAEASDSAATQPASVKAKLKGQIAELLDAEPSLPEERLAQEAAVLLAKSDVREELDRLKAHLEAVRALVDGGGAIGRRLDFLCQEFNREANTLCAKAADVELIRIGLAIKAAVDLLREQVQNIE